MSEHAAAAAGHDGHAAAWLDASTSVPGEGEAEGQAPLHPGSEAVRALGAMLARDPQSVHFFQAVRLLERLEPDRSAVGRFGDPRAEVVRFSVPPSISFPASEIQRLDFDGDGPPRMAVNFLGLTGPTGVLPHQYTLHVAERVRARDTAMRDFLDLFHHRLVSLFYRAWEKYRFGVVHERDRADSLTAHLADMVGIGTPGLRARLGLHDETLLFYAGLLLPQQRSAVALEQLLTDYFEVPVTVEQFVGGWLPLGRQDQCAVGLREDASTQLGLGAVVGDEMWDPQGRVRLRIGPLSRARYDEFLPGGGALDRLRSLVRFYTDDQFDVDVQLVLARDEVPACVLGSQDDGALPLGWATWLRTRPFDHDADETVLTL